MNEENSILIGFCKCGVAIAISVSSIMLAEADYFGEHEKGWHWYQSIPEPDDGKEKPATTNSSALERLKKYQQELEEAKAEAVLNPSPQNVAHYQRMQYAMLEKSGVFAKVWMQNVYKDQSLDYTQKFPVSAGARHIYLREQREEKEQKIQKLSQEYGLFFFVVAPLAQMAFPPNGKCMPTVVAKVNARAAPNKIF